MARPIIHVGVMFDLDNDHLVVTDLETDETMLDIHGDLDPFVAAFLNFSHLCEGIATLLNVIREVQQRPDPRTN